MIDLLRNYLTNIEFHQRLNALREYLQWIILQAIDDVGYRKNMAFVGGTCLRIVYGTSRFSEDLDFSLLKPSDYNTYELNTAILKRLERLNLTVESTSVKDQKNVASFFIRFNNLLEPLGLTPNKNQKLSIKLEVDKRPPEGAVIEEYLFQKQIIFNINHHNLPSLFATKLHALLFRNYEKGRDYYDLLFFLGKKTKPILDLFQNAVKQTHPDIIFPDMESVVKAVHNKIENMDTKRIINDIQPILLNPEEAKFLTKDILLKSLKQANFV